MSLQRFSVSSLRDPGHVVNAHQVTDTTPVSFILDMRHVDNFSCQVIWTGTIVATVKVYTGNSYNPNPSTYPASESTALNAGAWTDRSSSYTITTAPAGSAGNGEIHGTWVEACFVKVTITPTGGSGQLDVYASGKSVG